MRVLVEIPEHLWLVAQDEAEKAGLDSVAKWATKALIERLENGPPTISPSDD